MPISEKKKITNSRYIAKCDSIQIRPSKDRGGEIRAAAAAAGQSVQAYILQACAERMARDGFTPAESGEEGGGGVIRAAAGSGWKEQPGGKCKSSGGGCDLL